MGKKSRFIIPLLLTIWSLFLFNETINLYFFSELSPDEISNINKMQEVINLTQRFYVEDVDWKKSSTKAIEGLLHSLDPHSVYFTINEAENNDETFDGKYQGIGIQYDVIDSYINVISVIPGSPSEDVGILSGDIIIEIEGESAFGITNSEVPRKLKGPKGTKVKVGISRAGFDETLNFEITRDEIPIFTINTSFMPNDSTGYIWINRFAHTTADELENAMILMEKQGMKQLILDLRGNGGGFLKQSVQVAGKFLSGNKKIVYTKGRLPEFKEEHFSDDYGKSINRDYPLVVLVNGSSASASEIVAGALQDYDRALIVGTKSFGKGLVQNEFVLNDGSRLRLTISKYYTPSGRLIQKPYENKNIIDYYSGNESQDSLLNADSLNLEKYFTVSGREVFAGGGITPDTTIEFTAYSKSPKLTQKIYEKRIFYEVASMFATENKEMKENKETFLNTFKVNDKWFKKLIQTAIENDINFENETWQEDREFIENRFKAEIARNYWSQNEFWRVVLQHDNQFEKALKLFPETLKLTNYLQEKSDQN